MPSRIGSGPCAERSSGIGIVDRKIGVVAADDLAVRPQVFHEGVLDKAARLRHHVQRQAGQLRHAFIECFARAALRRRAGHGRQIVGHGEFFRVRQRGRGERVLALELGGRQRRQLQRRAQRRLVVAEGEPAFQHRRQHDDAGNDDALVALQRARHLGGAEAAIAFAEQIFRRSDAVVLGDIERDRLGERLGVAADAPEMLGVVRLHRAAPAGADRIDQHQVGEGEPGVGIVAQLRGRSVAAVGPEIEDARADQAEMQKGGGRARPAVEHESQRPVRAGVLWRHRRCRTPKRSARRTGRRTAACRRSPCKRACRAAVSMECSLTASAGSSRSTPLPDSC